MPARKRSAWMWIVVALIGVPMLYVLSLGPACWFLPTNDASFKEVIKLPRLYWILGHAAFPRDENGVQINDNQARALLRWYATAGTSRYVNIPCSLDGRERMIFDRDGAAARDYEYIEEATK